MNDVEVAQLEKKEFFHCAAAGDEVAHASRLDGRATLTGNRDQGRK
jgi:hypothetical protein